MYREFTLQASLTLNTVAIKVKSGRGAVPVLVELLTMHSGPEFRIYYMTSFKVRQLITDLERVEREMKEKGL